MHACLCRYRTRTHYTHLVCISCQTTQLQSSDQSPCIIHIQNAGRCLSPTCTLTVPTPHWLIIVWKVCTSKLTAVLFHIVWQLYLIVKEKGVLNNDCDISGFLRSYGSYKEYSTTGRWLLVARDFSLVFFFFSKGCLVFDSKRWSACPNEHAANMAVVQREQN